MTHPLAGERNKSAKLTEAQAREIKASREPFASVDSTDIAQNHHLPHKSPRSMADRWDAMQTPAAYQPVPHQQMELS